MAPTANLALINLFIGDIQGGLGPFLGTWLAESASWSPARVGFVITLVGIGTLFLSGPFGALVDRFPRPRLLIALACGAILVGTLLLLPARSFPAVLCAQLFAAAGGTLLLPAVAALTLGIVGKDRFPAQQGRNQAFNHVGILIAAGAISLGTGYFGPAIAFWVLGGMAVLAILATLTTPSDAWREERALGLPAGGATGETVGEAAGEAEGKGPRPRRAGLAGVFADRRLLVLTAALALFNLGNGGMLGLLGQKLVAGAVDATRWTAVYVMTAQAVMVPVALFAGSLADRRGRRRLLLAAFAVLPLRAALSAFIADPAWLIAAEVLDGVASGEPAFHSMPA